MLVFIRKLYVLRYDLIISPLTAPATPTLKELSNALDSVVDWYSLGVKLGMKAHELATIEKNYHRNNERCKLEMLSHCLQSAKLPSWRVVVDALQQMGEDTVASKIQAKYCSSSTVTTGMCLLCILELQLVCLGSFKPRLHEAFNPDSNPD